MAWIAVICLIFAGQFGLAVLLAIILILGGY